MRNRLTCGRTRFPGVCISIHNLKPHKTMAFHGYATINLRLLRLTQFRTISCLQFLTFLASDLLAVKRTGTFCAVFFQYSGSQSV